MAYWIGLMSGTSLDGVDAVLMQHEANEQHKMQLRVIAHSYREFSSEFVVILQSLQQPNQHEIHGELHQSQLAAIKLVRDYCAPAVFDVLEQANLSSTEISAIGAHGQTIRHRPELGFTLQLNAPALLAELTGITVVADFRSRDIAAGGQGAPLVPAFHQSVFSHPQHRRGILNLGGIANLTVLPATTNQSEFETSANSFNQGGNTKIKSTENRNSTSVQRGFRATPNAESGCLQRFQSVLGYDIGPCNVLLNDWIARHQSMAFDRDGAWARQGAVIPSLLTQLNTCEYLSRPAPKSTGRDDFNLTWLDQQIQLAACAHESPVNVMATLMAWMAQCYARECIQYQISELFVCGGGALNIFLMESIALALKKDSILVNKTDVLGIPVMQVEALAFAWLAQQCIEQKPANLPAVTGATGIRILGAIYQV